MDELLLDLKEYFEDRADAEYSTESASLIPNKEMDLLMRIEEAGHKIANSAEYHAGAMSNAITLLCNATNEEEDREADSALFNAHEDYLIWKEDNENA